MALSPYNKEGGKLPDGVCAEGEIRCFERSFEEVKRYVCKMKSVNDVISIKLKKCE